MSTKSILYILWNIAVLAVFGIDKYKSIHNKWRISERILLLLSFAGGSIGAALGMIIFNHKTKKAKFRILIPISVILNILAIYLSCKYIC